MQALLAATDSEDSGGDSDTSWLMSGDWVQLGDMTSRLLARIPLLTLGRLEFAGATLGRLDFEGVPTPTRGPCLCNSGHSHTGRGGAMLGE